MNKKALTEADICTKFITPAITGEPGPKKWDKMTQLFQELYFTKGRVMVNGKVVKRGEPKKADYVLFYEPNLPLAVVEAKDNNHSVGDGMQQALDYAEILDLPFAYSSNGDAFLEHDRTGTGQTVEREIPLSQFPTPQELWSRYRKWKGFTPEQELVATQPYYDDGSGKAPRYYQRVAINRTVDAIANGEKRILLVMATGTGKTYTAFQIIWRLWKSGAKKRILFLVDRNVLADQTKTNDFKPFGQAMTKITNRNADKAFEIYLALYQAVTGTEEDQNIYKQFSPDFFDLIVVDECHRGSADADAAWRKVLDYFTAATQIGMTATPKETKDVSNIDYFGEPVYTYSLRQGISDGFLAPYKVVRIGLDKDLDGWRPELGQTDKYGQVIEDREYNALDFDRNLILEKRTALVAAKITEFLKTTDRYAKTIVFCENIAHAERMRQALVNANPDLAAANNRYIMRITGDNDEGKAQLDNFIDPESTYPVLTTTSRLMATGVDAQTCKLIVLDRRIASMTEFKQIIGRGTRINEDYDKFYFTIMDFKQATSMFADPDFDGDPVQIYEPGADDTPVPPDEPGDDGVEVPAAIVIGGELWPDGPGNGRTVYVVADVQVVVATERVQYLDESGKLITESLKDYTRKAVRQTYTSLDAFLNVWHDAERKQAIIDELAGQGVFFDDLAGQVGREYDAFDLVCHVAFDQPPLTRRERADSVRKRNVFGKYGETTRAVLDALLDKYADGGLKSVESLLIHTTFEDANNYMKNGTLMRQVINKINGIDFNASDDRHMFGDIYEKLLKDLQSAGNAGEFYTPRAVTQFIVEQVNPRLRPDGSGDCETILDPACGTGGFLTCAIEHLRRQAVTEEDEETIQGCFAGIEKKHLPHVLCITNLMLHGIDVPINVKHDNTLARPLRDWSPRERVDVIVTNPPFGGMEEDGIEANFPVEFRTRETADLFLVLLMKLLKPGGRAGLVLPDGTLFGEGVKTRIKEELLKECNLHTVVRLPNGVFSPYTGIRTNLLFFTKGQPTTEVWYYEHPYPAGAKSYNKGKPIRIEEFEAERAWWHNRVENEHAWRVPIETIRAGNHNLDLKNPHDSSTGPGDVEHLLPEYEKLLADIAATRAELKAQLQGALLR